MDNEAKIKQSIIEHAKTLLEHKTNQHNCSKCMYYEFTAMYCNIFTDAYMTDINIQHIPLT